MKHIPFLLLEYLPDDDIYMAIPCIGGKPSPDEEYVFACEEDQQNFLDYYNYNPTAAMFAYNARAQYAGGVV